MLQRTNDNSLSATIGSTLTPLLFFTPPDRGSVKRVGIVPLSSQFAMSYPLDIGEIRFDGF